MPCEFHESCVCNASHEKSGKVGKKSGRRYAPAVVVFVHPGSGENAVIASLEEGAGVFHRRDAPLRDAEGERIHPAVRVYPPDFVINYKNYIREG